MERLIKIIYDNLCYLQQCAKNKWEHSTISNYINFICDKITPRIRYIYAIICGVLVMFSLPLQGVTNTVFSLTMIFFWYGIYVYGVTRCINSLIEIENTSLLDKFWIGIIYLLLIFMSMSFVFFKVAPIKNFADTFRLSSLNIISIIIAIIGYPTNLKYLISKSKKARDIVINSLSIGVVINILISLFLRPMVIFVMIQIYFLVSVAAGMKTFKAEQYSENSYGVIIRNRCYPKIDGKFALLNDIKKKYWDNLIKSKFINAVFSRISSLINSRILGVFINSAAIAIELYLSDRAYKMFNYITILPDSENFILIHLEAIAVMGFALFFCVIQISWFLIKSSSVGINVLDINKLFLVILFLEFAYQAIHAPLLTLLSIVLYLTIIIMKMPIPRPVSRKI